MHVLTKPECEQWLSDRSRELPNAAKIEHHLTLWYPPNPANIDWYWFAREITYREPALLWVPSGELDETFGQNAIRNPYFKPTKTPTTVRLDSDVLHWLRSQGNGYQTRINAVLRREMLSALRQEKSQ